MPNGFHGSRDEWERLEAPLRSLDSTLESFARSHALHLNRNGRGWPERSFRWGAPLNRLIQIYLEDEDQLTWTVWVCVSEDRPSGRYWKCASLLKAVPIDEISEDLGSLLEESFRTAESWSPEDLEFATELE